MFWPVQSSAQWIPESRSSNGAGTCGSNMAAGWLSPRGHLPLCCVLRTSSPAKLDQDRGLIPETRHNTCAVSRRAYSSPTFYDILRTRTMKLLFTLSANVGWRGFLLQSGQEQATLTHAFAERLDRMLLCEEWLHPRQCIPPNHVRS